ncbi:hypothetical protein Syun_019337 [Stephania yunnanensis]|uniref:Uncharacterized protein n=1 Tax=Stephania yunnanensis TaxID=152371 RepID=A0AAP0NXW9_9MAGN
MASEDVVSKTTGESAVSTIVNLAEEASEGVKAPGHALLSICKSLVAGGVAGGVSYQSRHLLNRLVASSILLALDNLEITHCCCSTRKNENLASEDAQLTPLLRLGAGACAGIIAMSATYPMDMVRGRLTVQTEKSPYRYRGIFHALSTVLQEEGPRALYRGWLPSVIGVVPYVGLNFAVYESLKDWLIQTKPLGLVQDNNELSVPTRLGCGAAAGTVGQTIAYPLDVIRRRMQMVGWNNASSIVSGDGRTKSALEYKGMIDAFRQTIRNEGFGALYKGLVPNSVKVVPSIAIAFVTYEGVKDILGVEMRISD